MSWPAVTGFRFVAHDPDRLAGFYGALGFATGTSEAILAGEMDLLGLTGSGTRLTMRLGPSRVDLDSFDEPGRPYPAGSDAASLVFQHLALVTDDARAAWARARSAGATPISRSGPVTLPGAAGGVTAIKFRDPEGHPLELLQFPDGTAHGWPGHGLLGIDHSAISVADVAASLAFYRACGLAEGKASLNTGPTQVALDGLDDVAVDVVPLEPSRSPPHLELLGYRHPRGRTSDPLRANDVAATRIVWTADEAALIRDPDGHLHQLLP